MVDFLKDQHLETEMNHYWTERSKSYSEQNRAQIENEKRHEWENMILKYAPQKECLNILDVGTGPGFFAIILAQKGHHVTAVDLTQDMLNLNYWKINFYLFQIIHLTWLFPAMLLGCCKMQKEF